MWDATTCPLAVIALADLDNGRPARGFMIGVDEPPDIRHRERMQEREPSSLTCWVVDHPALWSTATGLVMAAIGLVLFGAGAWAAVAIVGALFGLVNLWLWRAGGPGQRWRADLLRRFPRT